MDWGPEAGRRMLFVFDCFVCSFGCMLPTCEVLVGA